MLIPASSLPSLLREKTPPEHYITNQVVMSWSTNITFAIGGSLLMAMAPEEMQDISEICSAFPVNFDTLGDT